MLELRDFLGNSLDDLASVGILTETYLSAGRRSSFQSSETSSSRRSRLQKARATETLAGWVSCFLVATPSLLKWRKNSVHRPLPARPVTVNRRGQTEAKQPSDATCCTLFLEHAIATANAFST